ncbi:MAG TPA: hypothetical protein VFF27_05500 [Bacteroidia bacterium]|jgi:hypothetical protein|nr:hypothetical protein [Bacteroidia bacterium]
MKTQRYRLVKFSFIDGSDILFNEYAKDLIVDLETAKELVTNRLDFTENSKHYMIMEMSNIKKISHEAKLFMQDAEGGLKNILGAAFIVSNPVAELMSNIFIKTPKEFPAKLFQKKEDALNWIKQLKQKKHSL